MTAASLAALLSGYRFRHVRESGLQAGIAGALADSGVPHEREVPLSGRDRVDFLVGGVALEVKTGGSPTETARQLQRYARSPRVTELLLVTTVARHRTLPGSLGGKPLTVLCLASAAR